MLQIIFASIIGFIGLFIRGLTGFGSALVMTPLLLLIFEIKTVVVITAITEIAGGIVVTIQARKNIDKRSLLIVLPISIIGVAVGSFILVNFNSDVLKRVFGGFTILFALRIILNLLKGQTTRKKWPAFFGYLSGVLGGVLGGLFGTAGPPIAIYLENQLTAKHILRATMLSYFLIVDTVRIIPYIYLKLINIDIIKISLFMLPASFFGAFIGKSVHFRINEKGFRAAISSILLATGVFLLVNY